MTHEVRHDMKDGCSIKKENEFLVVILPVVLPSLLAAETTRMMINVCRTVPFESVILKSCNLHLFAKIFKHRLRFPHRAFQKTTEGPFSPLDCLTFAKYGAVVHSM